MSEWYIPHTIYEDDDDDIDDDRIPIHDGEAVIGYIDDEDVDWEDDADYGGAWIGMERLLGTVIHLEYGKLAIVSDGNMQYAYSYAEWAANNYVNDEAEQSA